MLETGHYLAVPSATRGPRRCHCKTTCNSSPSTTTSSSRPECGRTAFRSQCATTGLASWKGRRPEGQPPSDVWLYEGQVFPNIGLNAVAGKDRSEWGLDPTRYDEMLPGCYDPWRASPTWTSTASRPGSTSRRSLGSPGRSSFRAKDRGPRAGMREGLQRLDARRVVRGGPGAADPVHARAARRSRTRRGGGAPHRGQGWSYGHLSREPGPARPAVVPLRPLGSVLGRRRRV